MPICKKCGESFPNRVWIDGQRKNLCKRKYCLVCSPFGWHNTKQIHKKFYKNKKSECICGICGKRYIYVRGLGHTISTCNSCLQKKRKTEKRNRATLLLGGKCKKCGYKKCVDALCFHHKNPKYKKFDISSCLNLSWGKIEKEVKKCILLCNRCHSELHAGLWTINEASISG